MDMFQGYSRYNLYLSAVIGIGIILSVLALIFFLTGGKKSPMVNTSNQVIQAPRNPGNISSSKSEDADVQGLIDIDLKL